MILVNVIREGEKIRGGKAGNHPPQKNRSTSIYRLYNCIPENPRESKLKLTQSIKEFSKLVGYKVNIQKSTAFTYKTITRQRWSLKGPDGRFSIKALIINILVFGDYKLSIEITQLYH